uniref:Uncharacterized protein n=1 Tax=Ochrobactrum phage ORM_20 TaxID=2985243 RepID=A0A9N6WU29_9VIRU|nr:hypothetical protein ORM20_00175 [Ochrobactrum phage ORM_20]
MISYEEVRDLLLEDIEEKGHTSALIRPSSVLSGHIQRMVSEELVLAIRIPELDERSLEYWRIIKK